MTGHSVAMVTCYVKKMNTTYLSISEYLADSNLVASTGKNNATINPSKYNSLKVLETVTSQLKGCSPVEHVCA